MPESTTSEKPQPKGNSNNVGGPAWANDNCHECAGAGWVHPILPKGAVDYHHVIQCQTCRTYSDPAYRTSDEPLAQVGINPLKTFAAFQRNEANQPAYDAGWSFAHNTDKLPFLLLQGGTGNGKTHLCQAIAITLHRRGVYFRYLPVMNLMGELKRRIPTNSADVYLSGLKGVKALILDDVWADHFKSEWSAAQLTELIDYRYRESDRGYPMPTVLTTNLALAALPARIVSRFSDATLGRLVLNRDIDRRTTGLINSPQKSPLTGLDKQASIG